MDDRLKRAVVALALLGLAGCNGTIEDIAPKPEAKIPDDLLQKMSAEGMTPASPIMVRIFKEESAFEVWKQKPDGRYGKVASYKICKWSGQLGPKYIEGDRQAPEGFYAITRAQMNPKSHYFRSFNIGFPNAYDRAHHRTGLNLMVHGACSSAGCYSMTDQEVGQIFAFAKAAFEGGQTSFQVEAFPFRMTAANMARYRSDPNYPFWQMLKQGYDQFEITRVPPKVDVCDGRYVFNETPEAGHAFAGASAACPPMAQPPALVSAYQAYERDYDKAFAAAVKKDAGPPLEKTIDGLKEAKLVAAWSYARAHGKVVSREPPSFEEIAKEAAEPVPLPSPAPRPAAAAVASAAHLPAEKPAGGVAASDKSGPDGSIAADTAAQTAYTETKPGWGERVKRKFLSIF